MIDDIKQKISDSLNPTVVDLYDDSNDHRGHAAFKEGIATHLGVLVVADAFEGKSRVQRQRMVYKCLEDALSKELHAVTRLQTFTPDEYQKTQ